MCACVFAAKRILCTTKRGESAAREQKGAVWRSHSTQPLDNQVHTIQTSRPRPWTVIVLHWMKFTLNHTQAWVHTHVNMPMHTELVARGRLLSCATTVLLPATADCKAQLACKDRHVWDCKHLPFASCRSFSCLIMSSIFLFVSSMILASSPSRLG